VASHVYIGASVLEEHGLSFAGMKSYIKCTGGYFNQVIRTIFGHTEKEHVMKSRRVRGWSGKHTQVSEKCCI
jgi:hypothetical protein